MQNTQLIQTLRTIKEEELRQLGHFVTMHLPEKPTAVGRLFAYWHNWKKSGKGEEPALNKEVVQKAVFGQNVSPTRLRQAAAELYKIVQGFLVWQELGRQTSMEWQLCLNALQARGLEKPARDALKKIDAKRQKTPLGVEGYHANHWLAIHEYELAMSENNHQQNVSLIPALEQLDYYYMAQKLRFACLLANSNRVLGTQTVVMEEVEAMLGKLNIEEQPVLQIYHALYKLLYPQADAADEFPVLQKLLETAHLHFPPDELENIFQFAANRCIRELRSGNAERLQTLLDLYMEMDEKGLLLESGKMQPRNYTNIVRVACRLSKYHEAVGFTEKHKGNLPENEAENLFLYNMAVIAFHRQNYDDVLECMGKVCFNGVHDHVSAEMLYIKTYCLKIAQQYRQPDGANVRLEEALENKLMALKAFLRRNKTAMHVDFRGHQNFIKLTEKLSKAQAIIHDRRTRFDPSLRRKAKALLEAVREKLEADTTPIVDRDWLMERLEELERLF